MKIIFFIISLKKKKGKAMEIKFDKRNYRKHNDRNKELIRKSLDECGAGRSIVIDNEGEIIAGNGIYEQAQQLGLKTKIIETDGSELVVVKRTDLQTNDEKRKQLAIMDNSTSDSSEFDIELLQSDFDVPELVDFGIDVADVDIDDDFENEEEKDETEKGFRITYEHVFNNEDEQEQWYRFLQAVKRKYPEIETISERLLAVTNDWISKNE